MMTKNIVREALEHYIKTSNKPLLSWGLKPAWNKKKQKQAVSPAEQNAPSRSSRNLNPSIVLCPAPAVEEKTKTDMP